jgi:hypothetical protein
MPNISQKLLKRFWDMPWEMVGNRMGWVGIFGTCHGKVVFEMVPVRCECLDMGWDAFEKGFGTRLSHVFHFLVFSQNDASCGEFPKQGFWETLWHMYGSVWDINGVSLKGRSGKKAWQVLGIGFDILGHRKGVIHA